MPRNAPAVLAARNAARHQSSIPAVSSLGNQTLTSHSSSASFKGYDRRYANLGFGNGSSGSGSFLVVDQPLPPLCPFGGPPSYTASGGGGGSVVLPGRIITPGSNGQCILSGPGGTVITNTGMPQVPVFTGPQISTPPGYVSSVYWVPGANSGQQPHMIGSGVYRSAGHGR